MGSPALRYCTPYHISFIGDDELLIKGMECHSQRMASRGQGGYGTLPTTRFCIELVNGVTTVGGIAYLQ